jgi:hypothetical protein
MWLYIYIYIYVLFKEVKFEIFSVACCERMKSLELHVMPDFWMVFTWPVGLFKLTITLRRIKDM